MATAGGPDIERNGLVFGYDTSYGIDTNTISSRFYSGEPTTNLVTSPFEINNTTSTDIPPELVGEDITGYASYSSGYSVFSSQTSSTSSTGKTFQYSIWMRSPGGVSTYLLYVYDGTGPDGGWWSFGEGALTDKWRRITGSRSNMTGTVTSIRVYRRNQQGTIEILAPQLEVKSHVTPFLTGTRSSTESLIDLTKTTDINVSNVSFDSDGQPTFDGTDDRIDSVTGVGITDYSQPFTMECVFMVPTGATWANGLNSNIFSIAGSYAGQYGIYKYGTDGVGFQIRDATTGTYPATTGLLRDTYYHITAVFQGGSGLTLYRNGVSVSSSSTSFTGAPDTTNLYIGGVRAFGGSAGSWFQGEIPVAKYYNRALTAQEVQQNYNAYKNRFNL